MPQCPPSSPTPLGLVQGRDGFSPSSGHSAWGDISPSPSPPAFEQTQGEASGWGGLKIPPAWLLLLGRGGEQAPWGALQSGAGGFQAGPSTQQGVTRPLPAAQSPRGSACVPGSPGWVIGARSRQFRPTLSPTQSASQGPGTSPPPEGTGKGQGKSASLGSAGCPDQGARCWGLRGEH